MTANEHARFALQRRLRDVLGHDEAVTLMQGLVPPETLDERFARHTAEFRAELHDALRQQTMTIIIGVLASNLAFAGLILGLT